MFNTWEREVAVRSDMPFGDKHEELSTLGAAYKQLFQEGSAAKMIGLNVRRSHAILLERGLRLTVSMTQAERELAGMLSPQPRPSHIVPGTQPFISPVDQRKLEDLWKKDKGDPA